MTELRPTRNGVVTIVVTAVFASAIAVVRAFVEGRNVPAVFSAACISLVLVGFATFLYARNARVVVDESSIRVVSMFGRERVIANDSVATVLVARAVVRLFAPPSARVAVLDASGEPLVRLWGERWDVDAFTAASAVFDDRLVVVHGRVGVRALTDRFPLALPLPVRRPVVFALVLVGVAAAAVIGVAAFVQSLA